MKSIRSFILIAIGMMVFTVTGATHSNREQKQKTELVKGLTAQTYDVCVNDYQVVSVITDSTNFTSSKAQNVCNETFVLNPKLIVYDVGWCTRKKEQALSNINDKKPNLRINYKKSNPYAKHRIRGVRKGYNC